MVYRLSEQGASTVLTVIGTSFDAKTVPPWIVFGAVLATGLAALRVTTRRVGERWGAIQQQLASRQA
jgi:hypothetical protein